MDIMYPIVILGILFIGFPWVIFHYITKWKQSSTLTREDENLLDELHDTARRLDERLHSIERIITADHPGIDLRRPAIKLPGLGRIGLAQASAA